MLTSSPRGLGGHGTKSRSGTGTRGLGPRLPLLVGEGAPLISYQLCSYDFLGSKLCSAYEAPSSQQRAPVGHVARPRFLQPPRQPRVSATSATRPSGQD